VELESHHDETGVPPRWHKKASVLAKNLHSLSSDGIEMGYKKRLIGGFFLTLKRKK